MTDGWLWPDHTHPLAGCHTLPTCTCTWYVIKFIITVHILCGIFVAAAALLFVCFTTTSRRTIAAQGLCTRFPSVVVVVDVTRGRPFPLPSDTAGLRRSYIPYRQRLRGHVARGTALGKRKADAQGEADGLSRLFVQHRFDSFGQAFDQSVGSSPQLLPV